MIEDEIGYDKDWYNEIVGGALRIEKSKVLYPGKFNTELWQDTKKEFSKKWK